MGLCQRHNAGIYLGYRCPHRAAMLTCLFARPWRGGEAKNMAMVLGTLNTTPHDLVNIVASFMPPIAHEAYKDALSENLGAPVNHTCH